MICKICVLDNSIKSLKINKANVHIFFFRQIINISIKFYEINE